MSALVSVVIPAYNRAEKIPKALESVQAQTYSNWEIIVVDDGSKDPTAQKVREFSERDGRIHLVTHEKNRGAQAARNTGIFAARGEWIAFLDSDDEYLPDSLEKRMSLAIEENLWAVHSECFKILPDGRKELFGVPPFQGRIFRKVLSRPGPTFPGLLVKKSALERIGSLDEKIRTYQEWDTSIRLAKYFPFGFLEKPTFIYDCRGTDTISKTGGDARGYSRIVHKHLWDILRVAGLRPLAGHYANLKTLYEKEGDFRKARLCGWMRRACRLVNLGVSFWSCINQ